jgi:hypothetical protein
VHGIYDLNQIPVPAEAMWAAVRLFTGVHRQIVDDRHWEAALTGMLVEQGYVKGAHELSWAVFERMDAFIRYVLLPDTCNNLTRITEAACDEFSDAFVKAAAVAPLMMTQEQLAAFEPGVLEKLTLHFLQSRGNA